MFYKNCNFEYFLHITMKNTFAENLVSFLQAYDPFKNMDYADLLEIASHNEIKFISKKNKVFQINDSLHTHFYVVYTGTIHLTKIIDAQETLISKCYKGSVFGLRPLFAKNNYSLNAVANDDTYLIAIPIYLFKPLLAKYSDVLDYFLESFSNQTKSTGENYQNLKAISEINSENETTDSTYFQELEFDKEPLYFPQNTSISSVAKKMVEHKKNIALVTHNARIIGTISDFEFTKSFAFGNINTQDEVVSIMNTIFHTVEESISVAEAQLLLLKNEISFLCVTEDGSSNARIKGIISERDIIKSQSNNPGILVDEIRNCKNFDELKYVHSKYLFVIQNSFTKNIPLYHICSTTGELLHSIIQKCIELSIEQVGLPPVRFAWLSLGSQARKEQLTLGDQDSLLIYEDVSPEKQRDVKFYFVQLAKSVVQKLESLGYKPCPNEHLASSIKWCKSLSDFTSIYTNWIKLPGENMSDYSGIFLDYEFIYGEIKIKDALEIAIFQNLKNNTLFFDYIGNQLLKTPQPLNFFKKFNLEESGLFNIKLRGIQFFVDAARLFSLYYGLKGINNTYLRFKQLAFVDPKNKDKYLDFAENYLNILKFSIEEGIINDNDGSLINTNKLGKTDKEELKKSLQVVDDITDLVKSKFQLTKFS